MMTLAEDPRVKIYVLPILSGLVTAQVLGALAFIGFEGQRLILLPVALLIGATVTGLLTPQEKPDRRGAHCMVLIALSWSFYIILSKMLFPHALFLSDWVYNVMGSNIINAYLIISGVFLGSYLREIIKTKNLHFKAAELIGELLNRQHRPNYWTKKQK